jgi:hypothetical protein
LSDQLRSANEKHGRHEQGKSQLLSIASSFCFSLNCVPTGAQARSNFGMMAKKRGDVNMEEGQIRWPIEQ